MDPFVTLWKCTLSSTWLLHLYHFHDQVNLYCYTMAWSSQNSLYPNVHIGHERGSRELGTKWLYWAASKLVIVPFMLLYAALLHRLRSIMLIMPDYATGVHGQKSWEVNINDRTILTLILKKRWVTTKSFVNFFCCCWASASPVSPFPALTSPNCPGLHVPCFALTRWLLNHTVSYAYADNCLIELTA